MDKINILRFIHFVLYIPGTFALIYLISSLFYLCFNRILLGVMMIVSVLIAWLMAKRVKKHNPETPVVLVLSVIFVGFSFLVLANLNDARNAPPSASIKGTASSMRVEAELYFNDNDYSYEGVCIDSTLLRLKEVASDRQIEDSRSCLGPILEKILPAERLSSWFLCTATDDEYVIETYIPSQESYFCVDSTGYAGINEESVGDSVQCE